MTLVLSVVVLVSDDSGERDVRETLPALVRASMPAPDARRRSDRERTAALPAAHGRHSLDHGRSHVSPHWTAGLEAPQTASRRDWE